MEIYRVHDRFFRSFFGQSGHLKGLLDATLPAAVKAVLDLSTVAIEPGTWIDRHNREHLSDLAVSVDMVDRDSGSREVQNTHATVTDLRRSQPSSATIYILVEHKSYRDPTALLQLLRYMVQVWSAEAKAGKAPPLTPVIPILLYHGPAGGVTKSFAELFSHEIPEILKRYQVAFVTDILDLTEKRREDLAGDPASQAALWLMRSVRRGAEEALQELQAILHGAEERLTAEEYQALSRYLFETGELPLEELNGKIEIMVHQRRIREGLLTTAEQLIKKGYQEGEQIGIRKGIEQGEEAGRRALITSMIDRGMSFADVAKVTGLSVEEITALSTSPERLR